jgi:hypothetical protein
MLKRYRSAAIAVAALTVASTVAFAAGYFPGFPIVGSAAYCQGYSNYSTSVTAPGTLPTPNNCNSTVPAGPTIVTGNELIPADTGLSNQNPATVYIPMASINALPLSVATVVAANTAQMTATNTIGGYVLHSTGTITAAQIWLPANPIDGQQFAISADNTITTLTINLQGSQTASNKPTVLTVSTTAPFGYRFTYNAAATNWYRLN